MFKNLFNGLHRAVRPKSELKLSLVGPEFSPYVEIRDSNANHVFHFHCSNKTNQNPNLNVYIFIPVWSGLTDLPPGTPSTSRVSFFFLNLILITYLIRKTKESLFSRVCSFCFDCCDVFIIV